MSSSDVRSILNLPQAGPSAPRRSTTANPAVKKPDGISRELYALIGDNAPSLAEAQASIAAVKYREKPSLKSKKIHWEWTPFSPAARQDNPVKLGHWARITDADPGASGELFSQPDIADSQSSTLGNSTFTAHRLWSIVSSNTINT
ncbi:SWR1-complex protein 4 [Kwoniella sp. B9012]